MAEAEQKAHLMDHLARCLEQSGLAGLAASALEAHLVTHLGMVCTNAETSNNDEYWNDELFTETDDEDDDWEEDDDCEEYDEEWLEQETDFAAGAAEQQLRQQQYQQRVPWQRLAHLRSPREYFLRGPSLSARL